MFNLVGMGGLSWMDISLDIQTHLLKKRCVEAPEIYRSNTVHLSFGMTGRLQDFHGT